MKVTLIGDSITAGWVSTPGGGGCCAGWAQQLAARHPELDFQNLAVGGSTTAFWAGQELPAGDVAMVMLGVVDSTGGFVAPPTSAADYLANLGSIVDHAVEAGHARILLTGPTQVHFFPATGIVAWYNAAADAICQTRPEVQCGPDLFGALGVDGPYFEPGDVHPNAAGHTLAADLFEPALMTAVPEPATSAMLLPGLVLLAVLRKWLR